MSQRLETFLETGADFLRDSADFVEEALPKLKKLYDKNASLFASLLINGSLQEFYKKHLFERDFTLHSFYKDTFSDGEEKVYSDIHLSSDREYVFIADCYFACDLDLSFYENNSSDVLFEDKDDSFFAVLGDYTNTDSSRKIVNRNGSFKIKVKNYNCDAISSCIGILDIYSRRL